ncbi:MAG: hypothetical protein AAB217_24740 [Chloroflexota bacterium]
MPATHVAGRRLYPQPSLWEIAKTMKAAFEMVGVICRAFALPVDRQGCAD